MGLALSYNLLQDRVCVLSASAIRPMALVVPIFRALAIATIVVTVKGFISKFLVGIVYQNLTDFEMNT